MSMDEAQLDLEQVEPDYTEGIERLHALIENSVSDGTVRWKQFKFHVKEVSEDGTFSGYASVWGVVDSDDEVVDKGSCLRSLQHNPNFVLLWQHDIRQPIGFAVSAVEDEYGLKLKGELMLDCEAGKYAYAFLRKSLKLKGRAGLSIGFRVIKDRLVEDEKTKKSIRHFTELQLLETSVVTFAANGSAFVTAVKGTGKTKDVDGKPHPASHFAYVGNPDDTATWHLPIFDEKHARLAWDMASRTEGIPESETPKVIARIRAACKRFGIEISDGKASEHQVDQEKMMTTGDATSSPGVDFTANVARRQRQRELHKNRGDIESSLYDTLSAIHGSSSLDNEAKKGMVADCYTKYAHAMTDYHIKAYLSDHPSDGDESYGAGESKAASEEFHAKAGKMKVSAESKATLKHALDLHNSAIDLHNKAMRIVKDAFSDESGAGSDGNAEMGMSDDTHVDTKSQESTGETVTPITEQKSEEPVQQSDDNDSGLHSLIDELRKGTKDRLESI